MRNDFGICLCHWFCEDTVESVYVPGLSTDEENSVKPMTIVDQSPLFNYSILPKLDMSKCKKNIFLYT